MTAAITTFQGWPADAPAFLAEITADNSPEFWAANRHRHARAVDAPMRALAVELEGEFGPLRVFRPYRNRRFRPDADRYRTDAGATARSGTDGVVYGVVLSARVLSVAVGHWMFDGAQLRRYRAGIDEVGEELERVLAELDPDGGLAVVPGPRLTGTPRGHRSGHPRIDLLRLRGLQVGREWPVGGWLQTPEPLSRVRAAWRAAAPLAAWLDAHVGPPEHH